MAGISDFLVRRLFGSAISNATGYAIGGAIQPTLDPFVQDLENETWNAHPVLPLDADVAAEAQLRGYLTPDEAAQEARYTGVAGGRLDTLVALATNPPPLETLLALRRRDAISEPELDAGLRQLRFSPAWAELVKRLRNVVPSVTDMVRFAVRETYDAGQVAALDLDAEFPDAFADDAGNAGLSPERARQYWRAHWELPSAEQMAAMLFRGELSSSAFSGGLKALDYAPTWRGKLETILRPIPPLSDMIRFAVRDVYTPATVARFGLNDDFPAVFAEQAALHGMEDPYPAQYWAAHWRLPSALQGYRMLWRGIIDGADLDVLLKALDYPPFWRDRLRQLAHIVPGRIDLKRMLKHGILDGDEVEAGYIRLGYDPVDAARMRQIAEAELGSGTGVESHVAKARTSLFNRVHTEFTGRQLTVAEATSGLAAAGVPGPQVATILDLWTTEADLVRTELTQAQVVKAFRKGLYTEDEALAELVERGLTQADAEKRLEL